MNQVRLQPFCTANSLPEIDIAASIDLQNGMLAIEYQLRGDLSAIDIPSPAPIPTRKFKLWESTCCEFLSAYLKRVIIGSLIFRLVAIGIYFNSMIIVKVCGKN